MVYNHLLFSGKLRQCITLTSAEVVNFNTVPCLINENINSSLISKGYLTKNLYTQSSTEPLNKPLNH